MPSLASQTAGHPSPPSTQAAICRIPKLPVGKERRGWSGTKSPGEMCHLSLFSYCFSWFSASLHFLSQGQLVQGWDKASMEQKKHLFPSSPTSFVMISLLGTRKLIDMASRDNKKPCGQQGHRPLAAREQQERSILFLKACTSRAGQERGEVCLPQPTRRGKALVSKAFAYQRD